MSLTRQPEPELMDLPDEVAAYANADFAGVNQRFVDQLLALTGSTYPAAAIDLGCGPGAIAIHVARVRPTWKLTAVDASVPMLQWAARTAAGAGLARQIAWTLGDAKALPFQSSSFDVVFSNSLLHHLTDATAFWREAARITRPDGLLFVRDLYRPASDEAARQIVDLHARGEPELLREEFYRSLLSAYSPGEIGAQLRAAGLDSMKVEAVSDRHVDIYGRVVRQQ